jgi:hypothetical protein
MIALIFAALVSGCSELSNLTKDPRSLSSRVGNFSPTKLDTENSERKAAKLVTPLPRGTTDLNGKQEDFDPAFGSPETSSAEISSAETSSAGTSSAGTSSPSSFPSAYEPSAQQTPQSSEPSIIPLAKNISSQPSGITPSSSRPNVKSSSPANQFGSPGTPAELAMEGADERAHLNAVRQKVSQQQQFSQLGSGKPSVSAPTATAGTQGGPGRVSTVATAIPGARLPALTTTTDGSGRTPTASNPNPGGSNSLSSTRTLASRTGTPRPGLKPGVSDSSAFGKSQNGRTTVFMETPAVKPISEVPPSIANGNPQGFGCPPSGLGAFNAKNQQYANAPAVTAAAPGSRYGTNARGMGAPNRGFGNTTSSNGAAGQGFGINSSGVSAQNEDFGNGVDSNPVNPRFASPATAVTTPITPGSSIISLSSIPLAQSRAPVESAQSQQPRSGGFFGFGGGNSGYSSAEDAQIVNAQAERARATRVTITARVKKLLPDDRKGNPHQRFLLGLSNGTTVLVAHNIDLAPYVPLQEGSTVTICGEYIWNEKGGVLHYTHHTTNSRHQGGYIQYNGQTYQ